MLNYLINRFLLTFLILFGVILIIFFAVRLAPGDPVTIMLGDFATPETVRLLKEQMGLDRPVYIQFFHFLGQAIRGDFGQSFITRESVMKENLRLFHFTFYLALLAVLFSIGVGIPLGVIAALKHNTIIDRLCMLFSILFVSMPLFYLGILLILLFSIWIPIFPAIGAGQAGNLANRLYHLVLPSLTLGSVYVGLNTRITRTCMLEVLREDYMKTAWAKGLTERVVIFKHGFRNAMLPLVTIVGLNLGYLLGGSVVIEVVFARPGLGKLLYDSILARDYIQIQSTVFFLGFCFVLLNFLIDVSYMFLDPRIQYS